MHVHTLERRQDHARRECSPPRLECGLLEGPDVRRPLGPAWYRRPSVRLQGGREPSASGRHAIPRPFLENGRHARAHGRVLRDGHAETGVLPAPDIREGRRCPCEGACRHPSAQDDREPRSQGISGHLRALRDAGGAVPGRLPVRLSRAGAERVAERRGDGPRGRPAAGRVMGWPGRNPLHGRAGEGPSACRDLHGRRARLPGPPAGLGWRAVEGGRVLARRTRQAEPPSGGSARQPGEVASCAESHSADATVLLPSRRLRPDASAPRRASAVRLAMGLQVHACGAGAHRRLRRIHRGRAGLLFQGIRH